MKSYLTLFLTLISFSVFSQFSITGSSSATSAPNNAPAIVVDPAITLTSTQSIPAFRVRISSNFASGDVLSYTATLPSGVTASYASGTGILTFTGASTAANYQALLRTVTFNTTASSSSQRTVTFEAGDGTLSYNSSNGHYYMYVSGSYSWTAAKADAASRTFFGMTGYLATITSSSENTFINSLSGAGWLGGSDDYSQINLATGATTFASQAASEQKWYWVTGPEKGTRFSNGSTAVTYANWNSGEPNNSGGNENSLENSYAGSGYWNDNNTAGSNGYILEYGGVGTEPAVTTIFSRNITMVATMLQTVTSSPTYVLQAAAVYVDEGINVYSSGSLTDAKVTISGNFNSGDVLSYSTSLPSGITVSGTGYNTSTGVLSFSGTTTAANWRGLFRSVKFSSSSNVKGNREITFSVGNLVAGSNGHFYESVTSTANWATSKSSASGRSYMGLQGYLATITSSSENDFIKQKLGTDAWIGLSDDYSQINSATGVTTYANQTASEGKWYWVTGPEKGLQVTSANSPNSSSPGVAISGVFNNWNLGEPNNSSSNENYGEIYAASAPGKWNDLSGSGSLQYVVEYGGLTTDPLLFLSATATVINNSSLPVTGLELTAKESGKKVIIDFTTETEVNCDHFDILRGTDGVHFTRIGTLAGHGTIDLKQTYQWIDQSPANGVNYYRLQQFDIDGHFKYSTVKQVTISSITFSVAPNPAHSQIVITSGEADADHFSVVIYNASGRIVANKKISSPRTTVDISSYSNGVYIAERIGGGKVQHLLFIKQ